MNEWTLWSEQRPTDTKALYRWRVPTRRILKMNLRPEWSEKLALVGVGSGNEWWPGFSDWDGWKRTVPIGLEWRLATEDEPEGDIFWGGLNLLPSPFTGRPPRVEYLGSYVTAPPYNPRWLGIKSYLVSSTGWTDAKQMQDAWNVRPEITA